MQNRKVHKTEVVAILIKNNRLRALSASNSRKSKSSAIRLMNCEWASEGANEGTNERLHTLLIARPSSHSTPSSSKWVACDRRRFYIKFVWSSPAAPHPHLAIDFSSLKIDAAGASGNWAHTHTQSAILLFSVSPTHRESSNTHSDFELSLLLARRMTPGWNEFKDEIQWRFVCSHSVGRARWPTL
jgi:hypothetical protein